MTIGADTIIHPGVSLQGTTRIGAACEIHAASRIVDSTIGDGVTVLDHCVIVDSAIARRRARSARSRTSGQAPMSAPAAKVGNFVEIKKAVLGDGSKASHLAYLGDATIGENVNIGAGTITCNYDGTAKQTDDDRGRRVHRQRLAAHRAGHRRQGRLHRHRDDGERGRAARRAGRQRGQAAKHRRLGRKRKKT